MPTLVTQHRVKNYDAWRPHFDRHESKRAEYGITNPRVYRNASDPQTTWCCFLVWPTKVVPGSSASRPI